MSNVGVKVIRVHVGFDLSFDFNFNVGLQVGFNVGLKLVEHSAVEDSKGGRD
jgi:hypothetical protein